MQALIREKLLQSLDQLGEVVQVYRQENSRFVGSYYRWLEQTEQSLAGLRLPMVATIQSQKSQIMALDDGLIPSYIQATASPRKRQRAATAALLETLSVTFQNHIAQIDSNLLEPLDKLSQAIALLSVKKPDVLKAVTVVDAQAVATVWAALLETAELAQVMGYLAAKLDKTDREYCLQQVLSRTIGS